MNPLHQIVRAGHCRATHQLFAVDALPLVQTDAGKRLASWLRRYYRQYLRGAVDPDLRFRDFQNHVIHVPDGFWGGAPRVAHQWYDRLQRYLRQQRFSAAAHAAGVLSHYFTDPIQPLNTAYSQAEEVIHLPLLRSIQRAYPLIYRQWRDDEFRVVFQLADGPGWLGAAMLHGAKFANQRFDVLVNSYRLSAAVGDPSVAIGPQLRIVLAELFGLAITGWARVIERAARDAEAVMRKPLPRPSRVWPLIPATATLPAAYWGHWIQSRMEDRQIKELVAEFHRTGKLEKHLPAEVDIKKRVIDVYRRERRYRLNRKRQLEQRTRQPQVQPVATIAFLSPSSGQPIESLGIDAEDLKRLRAGGIQTMDDLEHAAPAEIAARLHAYWITDETVGHWQRQAALMRQVSGLTTTAARMLVGAGFHDPVTVSQAEIDSVFEKVVSFAATTQGRRCLHGKPVPTRQQVYWWVQHVKSNRNGQKSSPAFRAAS